MPQGKMPLPCVLSPVPTSGNFLSTHQAHTHITFTTHGSPSLSPLSTAQNPSFRVKYFTKNAFSNMFGIFLIGNPLASSQSSSYVTPLPHLM